MLASDPPHPLRHARPAAFRDPTGCTHNSVAAAPARIEAGFEKGALRLVSVNSDGPCRRCRFAVSSSDPQLGAVPNFGIVFSTRFGSALSEIKKAPIRVFSARFASSIS